MSGNKSPWGSGSGGNGNGGSGGNKSPWGQGGNNQKPKQPQNRPTENPLNDLKKRFGRGGSGGGGPRRTGGPRGGGALGRVGPFGLFLLVGALFLLFSCVYMVDQNEEAVILRLGEYSRTSASGLHFKLPDPIETKEVVKVTDERSIDIGVNKDNLMLTGDENIVRIAYSVLWNVKPGQSQAFLFNLEDVPRAVSDVAESAMREIVGKTELEPLITDERDSVASQVQSLMQEMLDEYKAGVNISQVEIKESQEPRQVEQAFLEVVAAKQEKEQSILRAQARENELIPAANAEADRLIQEASGYKEAVIAESKGDASRFVSIYEEYKLAPRVTRDRMYLETMEEVYRDSEKIILDDTGGSGVVPYLPLDKLGSKPAKAQ